MGRTGKGLRFWMRLPEGVMGVISEYRLGGAERAPHMDVFGKSTKTEKPTKAKAEIQGLPGRFGRP